MIVMVGWGLQFARMSKFCESPNMPKNGSVPLQMGKQAAPTGSRLESSNTCWEELIISLGQ